MRAWKPGDPGYVAAAEEHLRNEQNAKDGAAWRRKKAGIEIAKARHDASLAAAASQGEHGLSEHATPSDWVEFRCLCGWRDRVSGLEIAVAVARPPEREAS